MRSIFKEAFRRKAPEPGGEEVIHYRGIQYDHGKVKQSRF